MDSLHRSIGTNLRNIRREMRISRQAVVDMCGISEQTIKQIENESRDDCKASTIIALSEGLGVSADYLLGLSDVKPSDLELRVKEICFGLSAEDVDMVADIVRLIVRHGK